MGIVKEGANNEDHNQGRIGTSGDGGILGTDEKALDRTAAGLTFDRNLLAGRLAQMKEGVVDRGVYDTQTLRWVHQMYDYFHQGAADCPLVRTGQPSCTEQDTALVLCWICAGGSLATVPAADYVLLAGSDVERDSAQSTLTVQATGKVVGGVVKLEKAGEHIASRTLVVRISSIGHCRREVAYGMQDYEETNPSREEWQNSAWIGSKAEELIVRRLEERGFVVKNAVNDQETVEWAFKDEVLFRGHPDGNIWHSDWGPYEDPTSWKNLELKYLKDNRAEDITAKGMKSIVPDYYDQVQGYMRTKDQTGTLFVAGNRNTGVIPAGEIIKFEKERWRSLVDRWREVAPIIMAGELPEPDHDGLHHFHCIVCNFKQLCPAWQKTHPSPLERGHQTINTMPELTKEDLFGPGNAGGSNPGDQSWRPRAAKEQTS
jgi:hypothetical protein